MKTEIVIKEEKEKKTSDQQKRCEDWGLHHLYCKSYGYEYCPKICAYAIKMDMKE